MTKISLVYPINENDIENITKCPVCGNSAPTQNISYVMIDELIILSTDYCTFCGFVFRRQRPSLSWFESSWDKRDSIVVHKKPQNNTNTPLEQRRYHRYKILAEVLEEIQEERDVLDIGTGPGTGLQAFHDRGWKATGLEPDPSRSKIAKQRGLDIIESTIEEYQPRKKFNNITLVQTLEHFHDPYSLLKNVCRALVKNGCLYIEVPNINVFVNWRDSLYLEHMNNFSVTTLCILGERIGLKPVYRLFPKTIPFGIFHLGLVFEKINEPSNEAYIFKEYNEDIQKLENVRQLYMKGLPVPLTGESIIYSVPYINDIAYTYRLKKEKLIYNQNSNHFTIKDKPLLSRFIIDTYLLIKNIIRKSMIKTGVFSVRKLDNDFEKLRCEPIDIV